MGATGKLKAKSATRNGRPADVVGHRLVFDKQNFEIRGKDGMVLFLGTYVVQPEKTPRRIDFRLTGQMKGTVWKGIYERKQDRLTICDNAPDTKQQRPIELQAPLDSGYILILFDSVEK